MSTENIININSLGLKVTDEEAKYIYDKLSDVDKTSSDNLTAAKEETESCEYTSDDNNIIEPTEEIPGVNVIPDNIAENIKESEANIEDVLKSYDLDEESMIQMLKVIGEYKSGDTSKLYSRVPKKIQEMINGLIMTETNGVINYKEITSYRNRVAKMFIDDFINDAKISASVDEFNSEMANIVNEMNTGYDNMISDAIDKVFNNIESIRAENPKHAEVIESVKNAFDKAHLFEKQLNFAQHTSYNRFIKYLDRYKDDVYYYNKKVNSNNFGIKVRNIEDLLPIIKLGLPQYAEEEIKKFIICICRTVGDTNNIAEIAYEYRMVCNIYKYKFIPIDEAGEVIFSNIAKVIECILSRR